MTTKTYPDENKPQFDPNKPFTAVDKKPVFDPNKPFTEVKKKETAPIGSTTSSEVGDFDFVTEGGIRGWYGSEEDAKREQGIKYKPLPKKEVAASTGVKRSEINKKVEEEARVQRINNEINYAQKAIDKGQTLEDMAALFMAQQDEKFGSQFQQLRETGLFKDAPITEQAQPYYLPADQLFGEATKGKIMQNALSNPQFLQVLKSKPELYARFKEESANFLNNYPEAGKVYLGNILSNKMEEMGINNGLVNVVTKKELDEVVKKAKEDGDITPQEEFFINREIRPRMGYENFGRAIIGKPAVKTTGAIENALEGAIQGSRNLGQGIAEFTGLRPLIQGDKGALSTDIEREQRQVAVKPVGLWHEMTQAGGQILGQSLATGGAAKGLVSAGVKSVPLALGLAGGMQAYGNYAPEARRLFPESQLKQRGFATVMSLIEAGTEGIFRDDKVVRGLMGELSPALKGTVRDFTAKKISAAAAKESIENAFKKAVAKVPEASKYFAKAVGENTLEEIAAQIGQDATQGIFEGKPVEDLVNIENIGNTARQAFLGSGFIGALATRADLKKNQGISSKQIYLMARDPETWAKEIRESSNDPADANDIEDKLSNLDYAANLLKELDTNTKMTEKQKAKYVLLSLQSKTNAANGPTATDNVLRSQQQRNITETQKEIDSAKEELASGKDDGTFEGDKSDKVSSSEEKLFVELEKAAPEGYKATLGAAKTENNILGGIEYMQDKAAENPVKFQEEFGEELTNKVLKNTPTEKIQQALDYQLEMDSDSPNVGILDKILQDRESIREEDVVETSAPTDKASNNQPIQKKSHKDLQFDIIKMREDGTASDENAVQKLYDIQNEFGDKYTDIELPNGKFLSLRISDHSGRLKNTDSDRNLSIVITNDNKTLSKYNNPENQHPNEYYFDATEPTEGIIQFINDRIEEIKAEENETSQELQQPIPKGVPEATESNEQVGAKETQPAVEAIAGESKAAGEGQPPISEPPKGTKVFVQRPATELSHKGLQDVANEFSLPDVETRDRKSDIQLRKDAENKINEWVEKGEYGKKVEGLVKKAEDGEILTDEQRVILEQHLANISQELREIPKNSPEFDAKLAEVKRLKDAGEKTRSEAGAALRIPTFRSRPKDLTDYYVAEMEAAGVDKLTEQQKEKVEKEFDDITAAEKAYQDKINALQEENAKLRAEAEVKKARGKAKGEKKDFKAERDDIRASIQEKLKKARGETSATFVPYAKELIAIAPDVSKLMKSYVEQGITELTDLVRNIHDDIKDAIPDITEKDVRDIIAGEYNEKRTRSQLAAQLKDLRDEAKLINRLDELESGVEPTSERKKIERNRQFAELKNKIKGHDLTKLSQAKSRIKGQIEDIEKQIQAGNFAKEEKQPLKLDQEAKDLQDKLIKLKQERERRILMEEQAKASKWDKIKKTAINVLGVPRSIMSSVDFSAPLRQAFVATVSNPGLALKAGGQMFKSAFSQKNYDRWFDDLSKSDRYQLMLDSKLGITNMRDPKLTAREEEYMSNLAQKIPLIGGLVKGSERAYSMYLNKMRVDVFNRLADQLQENGKTWENSEEQYKQLAKFVNNITGRGDLQETLDKASPLLNTLFFSPRLMASRINTLTYLAQPRFYKTVPAEARKAYFKGMVSTAAVGLLVLGLAKAAGADTEDDPRSPDFGKIKSGNTRWDIWGGHQQYIRLIAQMITGQRKSSTSGKITNIGDKKNPYSGTRGDLVTGFLRGKASPVAGIVTDVISGENVLGQKLGDEIGWGQYAMDHLLPLNVTGIADAVKDQGAKGLFTVGVPSTFGVGVQTYPSKK